jgi:cardiolipin synthase
LIWDYPLLGIPLGILIVKEILAATMNMLTLKKTGLVVAAVWHGKLNTVILYITIFIHIVWPLAVNSQIPQIVSKILIFICIGIMFLSSILYTKSDVKAIKQEKE